MSTTRCYAASVEDVSTIQQYQMAYRTLLLNHFNKDSNVNSVIKQLLKLSHVVTTIHQSVVYCTCVITDICMYTCRLVSTILNTLVLMHTKCIFTYNHHNTHMSTHMTMCMQNGFSPLYIAGQEGHDRIVEKLLQAGATVDLQSKVENCYYMFICHL